MRFVPADGAARPLGKAEMAELLEQPNIMRIAVIDFRDGTPLVHPVWHYFEGNKFFVAVDRDGTKAQSLRKNPSVYFLVDVDPEDGPPRGVRGKGTAKVVDDPEYATEVTRRNILRYIGSLEGKAAQKLLKVGKSSSVVEITPSYMASWKF